MKNTFSAIRVVYLPPMTVTVIKNTSASPEYNSLVSLHDFIQQNDLIHKKPDFRHFGFSPKMPFDNNVGTYERWVTVPDEIENFQRYEKRRFAGGEYAAFTASLDCFDIASREFRRLLGKSTYKVAKNDDFIFLEEYMNVWLLASLGYDTYYAQAQIDLLIKIEKH